MTPDELKLWMDATCYGPHELAYDLGVHWTMVYGWLKGQYPISEVTGAALRTLGRDRHAIARRKSLRMTAQDLQGWMTTHGYSLDGLALQLGIQSRTLAGLVSGSVEIPRVTALALRALARERARSEPQEMTSAEFVAWMRERGYTQVALARALDLSLSAVNRWARGSRGVSPSVVLALRDLEARGLPGGGKIVEESEVAG